jgi:ammonia channel protein AmtB
MQKVVGLSKFFMSGIGLDSMYNDIPETVFFMFQMTFAIITPALFVGFCRTYEVFRSTVVQPAVDGPGLCARMSLGLG